MDTLQYSRAESASAGTVMAEKTGAERRRRPRIASRVCGFLLPVLGKPLDPWEVRVQDVSRHGVGFSSSTPMKRGEICRIRIGRGPMDLAKRMRVVNCRASLGDRTYAIGGEFF